MAGSHRRERHDPASDLFDRWMSHRQEDAETPASEPGEPAPEVPPQPAGVSTDVEFTPRTRARRVVGLVLLAAVCGLAVAAYIAYRDSNTLAIGIAAVLLVLVLALWAIRASSPVAHLAVRSGQLEVTQGGGRFVFDLSGGYTPIEVVGSPGDRDWRVLFLRRNMEPFEIDSSMVDPQEFMDVLRRYLPG
jgi:hypothetical protein